MAILNSSTEELNKPSPVRKFNINGLFGDRDIKLNFESAVTILIGDNGSGKSTILSTLYAALTGQTLRLKKHQFQSIDLEFRNGKTFHITPDPKRNLFYLDYEKEIYKYPAPISQKSFSSYYSRVENLSQSEITQDPMTNVVALSVSMTPEQLSEHIISNRKRTTYTDRREASDKFYLPDDFPKSNCIYFPTYRRIEEELSDIGLKYTQIDQSGIEGIIRFGMGDVSRRLSELTERIRKTSQEWYARTSSQLLANLIEGFKIDDSAVNSIGNPSALKIALDRMGDNISEQLKIQIVSLINSGDIWNETNRVIAFHLANLIQTIGQNTQDDISINKFINVCNKYFSNKEFVYNEGNIEVYLADKQSGNRLDLARLSSGEKQIVSLFSRLYLELTNDIVLLFDEPELSLSLEWQRMLLPDLVDSGRCSFLLATTHSPFIFENELDFLAQDLESFVHRSFS